MKKSLVFGVVLCLLSALSLFGTRTFVRSASGEKVIFTPGNTSWVCQLTGEKSINKTYTSIGLHGTDLGYSFEHLARNAAGVLFQQTVFLFGDTLGVNVTNLDSIAFANDSNPVDCIDLDFVTEPTDPSRYHPPIIIYPDGVTPIANLALGIPSYGFSANRCVDGSEKIYAFFSSFSDDGVSNPMRSLLAYSCDSAQTFHYLYEVSSQYFINGSSVIVDNANIPGLPQSSGRGLLIWASGEYRKSDVRLAFVPLDQVENRSAWRYYRDPALPGGGPWVAAESQATPVLRTNRFPQNPTPSPCVGELSVTWNQFLNKWLILYNCNQLNGPSQVRFHVANLPWGPWSEFVASGPGGSSTILFQADREGAIGNYMHQPGDDDGLDDNTLFRDAPGDPYGPYVISRYTTGDTQSTTIYYTLSTWNPYQVMLMKSTLRLQRPPVANAGPDQTVSADSQCLAQVTLDGTGSSDPDGDPLTYTWTGPFGKVTGPSPAVTLPLGTSIITLTVDDGLGGTASDQVAITVQDITPPSLSVTLTPDTLWSPNHALIPITAEIVASDNCDANPAVTLVSITSSEPDNGLGDGDTARDIQNAEVGTDDRAFLLRAERSGMGTGRIYTIIYRAQDASGNGTTVTEQVIVPRN